MNFLYRNDGNLVQKLATEPCASETQIFVPKHLQIVPNPSESTSIISLSSKLNKEVSQHAPRKLDFLVAYN